MYFELNFYSVLFYLFYRISEFMDEVARKLSTEKSIELRTNSAAIVCMCANTFGGKPCISFCFIAKHFDKRFRH